MPVLHFDHYCWTSLILNFTAFIFLRSVVIRHYEIFYKVRSQLTNVIFNTLRRLFAVHYSQDVRRISIEFCDIVIRWEQEFVNRTVNEQSESQEVLHDFSIFCIYLHEWQIFSRLQYWGRPLALTRIIINHYVPKLQNL